MSDREGVLNGYALIYYETENELYKSLYATEFSEEKKQISENKFRKCDIFQLKMKEK